MLCFQFGKFYREKYSMPRADEDGRMLFLLNEFLLYIFKWKWKWNRETGHFVAKNF